MGIRVDAEPRPTAGVVRLRHGVVVPVAGRAAPLYDDLPFFRTVVDNLEMTLAKSSLEVARGYLELVPDAALRDDLFGEIEREQR